MNQKLVLTSYRDIPLLLFLWRWKIASTKALHYRFFNKLKLSTTYHRLYLLKKAGFIQIQTTLSGQNSVWCLDKKGFLVSKDYLPTLKEEGYKAEHMRHDLICQAIHLGDFLKQAPSNIELVTEQELRRVEREYLPDWLPYKTEHRPDGYWYCHQRKKTLALEVELHQKTTDRFTETIEFYADHKSIDRIIWLLSSLSLQRKIQSVIERVDSADLFRHYFLDLSLFLKRFWAAEIRNGLNSSFTLQDFLWEGHKMHIQDRYKTSTKQAQDRHKTSTKQAQNRHKLYCASFILDHRLSAYNDKGKGIFTRQ